MDTARDEELLRMASRRAQDFAAAMKQAGLNGRSFAQAYIEQHENYEKCLLGLNHAEKARFATLFAEELLSASNPVNDLCGPCPTIPAPAKPQR